MSYSFNVDQWCSFDFQEAISCLLIRKMSCKKREKNITLGMVRELNANKMILSSFKA